MKNNKNKAIEGVMPTIKNAELWKRYQKIGELCESWERQKDAGEAKDRRVMQTPIALLGG